QNPPGTVQGALVAEIPLAELSSHLEEVQAGSSRSAFLVRNDGRILVHRDLDRVLRQETFTVPADTAEGARSFSGRGGDEVSYLYAAAPITNIPAAVVLQQQESEALAAVSTSTRNLAFILLAVILVTVATISVTGRWLLAPLRSMEAAARRIGRGEQGARVPVTGYGEVGRLGEELNRMAESLEQRMAELEERKAEEAKLREQTILAETLYDVGKVLTAQLDLQEVVQAVTNIATELTGAQFGAFFYNVLDEGGESYTLYTLAGVSPESFSKFPMPRNTDVFGPTFRGEGTARSDDITADPVYGRNEPYFGMPKGHLPVRSYLAVPVVTRHGEVLGGLFFGHEEVGVFKQRHAQLAEGIAGQAVIAIENARLYAAQRSAAETLQRSLLPSVLPKMPGLQAAARYLPAVPGVEVGGDWYDLITLPDGSVVVIVGDVVGRGTVAAGTMGQLCHALRAYALENPSPSEMLGRLNRFLVHLGTEEQIATVVVAVLNLEERTLCMANAGHPPPLRFDGAGFAEFLEIDSGPPIGALPDTIYKEYLRSMPENTRLVLYTDGLVEDRRMPLTEGLERLRATVLDCRATGMEDFCDYVVSRLAMGRDVQDDIAVLAIGPEDPS
ncbi:MAG TPA: SpoIIE family protein phosphatase, partial [Actinomycetota bacterium]|nr:SpoIIE family protein phosphatase [Actinomycetota bacterium]